MTWWDEREAEKRYNHSKLTVMNLNTSKVRDIPKWKLHICDLIGIVPQEMWTHEIGFYSSEPAHLEKNDVFKTVDGHNFIVTWKNSNNYKARSCVPTKYFNVNLEDRVVYMYNMKPEF